jgi:hypothetical protein
VIEILEIKNKAEAFWNKYQELGNIDDLDMTIFLEQEIVDMISEDSSKQESLHNLAISVLERFKRTGNLKILEKAIELQEQIFTLIPEGTEIPATHLEMLGRSLALTTLSVWAIEPDN